MLSDYYFETYISFAADIFIFNKNFKIKSIVKFMNKTIV